MKYWLMKSEADVYSIDDLKKDGKTLWDNVRNYQARNHMRDMSVGDLVLYYHSRQTPSAVAGLARVCSDEYPDPGQFDPKNNYFDPKSSQDDPRWWLVDLEYVASFDQQVGLPDIKAEKSLAEMVLVKNSRLSVQPVRKAEFDKVLKMAGHKL